MATLNIGGQRITVGDEFLKLTPDQQNATVEEIAASLGPQSTMETVANTGIDTAKGVGSGVVTGAAQMVGMGGDLNDLASGGLKKLEAKGVDVQGTKDKMLSAMPAWLRKYHEGPQKNINSQSVMNKIDETTGLPITAYEPSTRLGKVGKTVGTFIAPAMAGGGGIIRGALAPGVVSEVAGQLLEGTGYETAGRVGGAVLGGSILPKRAGTTITADHLSKAATKDYESPAVTGLRINPAGPAAVADDAARAMERGGARPYNAQPAFSAVDELRDLPNTGAAIAMKKGGLNPAATVEDIKGVRTVLNETINSGTDPITGKLNTTAKAALAAKNKITAYLDDVPAGDVVAGDAAAAGSALKTANANYAASMRSRTVDALLNKADTNAAAANSGQNANNARRQQLKSLLLNERKNAGFSAKEMSALEKAVLGTKTGNAARFVGNALAPSGALALGNSAAAAGIGAGAAHLLGGDEAVAGASTAVLSQLLGRSARRIGNSSQARQSAKFQEAVVARSPLAQDKAMMKQLGIEPTRKNIALVQALLAGRDSRSEPMPQTSRAVDYAR